MKNIILDGKHVYLDDHDISEFVIDVQAINSESVAVILRGEIIDKRKAKKPETKKKVKDDR